MFAPISEIFDSVQGEGPYVGVRQAFVRFVGCNLNCFYCDTPREDVGYCRFEKNAGSNSFEELTNPLTENMVEGMLEYYKHIHSISLTGGEPLLHADFINQMHTPAPLYLESNMTLPQQAKKIKDRISYVAGDVKLTGEFEGEDFESHLDRTIECFRVLKSTKTRDCFCKIVVTNGTNPDDVLGVVGAISNYISCVVLQPVTLGASATTSATTVTTKITKPAPVQILMELQKNLIDEIDTRIIPQTHKMWGCL
ncbi:MAG: 7-carboxy-7-deazaguanine synthase QueE [Methanosarcinaceae archaeon]|nr:7-carboxy-7-deazaguanine synthase QueE [Methanosarcinaceae archaeon]